MQQRHTAQKLYLGTILDSKIVTATGRHIGHVADIQLSDGPEYKVIAFIFGRRGWLYRLHVLNPFATQREQRAEPKTIPWEAVERIEKGIVRLKP